MSNDSDMFVREQELIGEVIRRTGSTTRKREKDMFYRVRARPSTFSIVTTT